MPSMSLNPSPPITTPSNNHSHQMHTSISNINNRQTIMNHSVVHRNNDNICNTTSSDNGNNNSNLVTSDRNNTNTNNTDHTPSSSHTMTSIDTTPIETPFGDPLDDFATYSTMDIDQIDQPMDDIFGK